MTFKAEEIGYTPNLILAARQINNGMGKYVAEKTIKEMIKAGKVVKGAKILILGVTFKEDCPDMRNTKVIDIIEELKDYDTRVDVYDPWVDKDEAVFEYNIKPIDQPLEGKYDAILLAVLHKEFKELSVGEIRTYGKDNHVLYDIKYLLKANESDGRL